MFTGIIEATGQVLSARVSRDGLRLAVKLGALARGVKPGDSIAVDGCCLTVSQLALNTAQFDLIPETLRLTTFRGIRAGARVNLERASRVGDRLDGHIVQGHVDGIATVVAVTAPPPASNTRAAAAPASAANAWSQAREWTLTLPPALLAQLVPKGSIALDGISLTIAKLTAKTFTVAIIPETLRRTTLGSKLAGAQCHVELDILGKYIHRYLAQLELPRAPVERSVRAPVRKAPRPRARRRRQRGR